MVYFSRERVQFQRSFQEISGKEGKEFLSVCSIPPIWVNSRSVSHSLLGFDENPDLLDSGRSP